MSNFVAEKDPSDSICSDIEDLAPQIPYYTKEYRDALQMCRKIAWVLGLETDGRLVFGCLGEMTVGKLRKQLHIQSTPSDASEEFWSALGEFCRQERVTTLSLGTIGTCPDIPIIGRVFSHKVRCEYWVDLQAPDIEMALRPQQRRVLRKARARGLELRVPPISSGLATHNLLSEQSLGRRRERGESIPVFDDSYIPQALIETGAARIYECVLEEEVLGSVIITVAKKGVHGYSAGYSRRGMKLGAAVFLSVATFQSMRSEGKSVFNLGDAPRDSGLAVFKRGLGSEEHESLSKSFDTASPAVRFIINGYSSLSQILRR
ncbi:MAG: GNAT family N-acetyltransferase [Gammaproteobacteria bacterium]|nr:GNAT family N-acetyltransferase [Gammaproteobacteria bacterium]